jgi:dihydroxyacetone kinase-like predicted kinase
MRFLILAKIPTEDGNKMVQDPNLLEKLEKYINKVKAEATYFFEANGNRVASFIAEIESADQIPVLAEPLFSGMGANVEFHPVMSFDDLKKGMPQAVVEVDSYRY